MNNIKPISTCLATSSEVVSDLMYTVTLVFCDIGGLAITQHLPCRIIENLFYDIVKVMDWFKSTNPVIG